MVDPKTSAVLLKYHDDALLLPMLAHYKPAQQILGMQLDKTFITVWSGEAQVPELKISLAEAMSCLKVSSDSRLLYGGSASGNLHLWELPSGLLLRKRNVHAGAVLDVSEQPGGYLITVGVDCVKMWPMATLVIETETVVCCKCYQSVLSIKAAVLTPTGLLGVLSEKAVVVL